MALRVAIEDGWTPGPRMQCAKPQAMCAACGFAFAHPSVRSPPSTTRAATCSSCFPPACCVSLFTSQPPNPTNSTSASFGFTGTDPISGGVSSGVNHLEYKLDSGSFTTTTSPVILTGLAEGHAKPGFATLAGLVLYAAADPVDIRSIKPGYQTALR